MKKNNVRLFMMLMITLVLSLFTLTGCSEEEVVMKETVVPVETLQVQPSSLVSQVTLAGEIVPKEEVSISTKIPGKINKIHVQVDDEVEEGTLLFELENQDLKASVEQAKQNLAITQANLANIKNGARSQEIEQANQLVNQAEIQLNSAKTDFERIKELYEANAISKQQYDQALSQLQIAETAYKSAVEQQSLIKEGATQETIDAAESQVGLARANLDMAQAKLNDTYIYSPINGRIGFIKYDAGEFVMQGAAVVQVIHDKEMIAKVDVSETEISYIKLNDQVNVKIAAVSSQSYKGIVTEISPVANQSSKVYPIEITIQNPNGEIKSGMTASVILALEKKEKTISVPVDATFEELGEYNIYRVESNRAVKTKIKTGINNGIEVEVTEGLKFGDVIIVKGQNQVSDGDLVSEGGRSQ